MKFYFYALVFIVILIGFHIEETTCSRNREVQQSDNGQDAFTDANGGHARHGRGHGQRGHRGRGHGVHGRGHEDRAMTEEEKLNLICHKYSAPGESASTGDSGDVQFAQYQHKLNRYTPEARQQIIAHLSAKEDANRECCQLTSAEKGPCLERKQRERYDRVCANEEPLCYWAALSGSEQMVERMNRITTECCDKEGDEAYECFDNMKTRWQRKHGKRYNRRHKGHQ